MQFIDQKLQIIFVSMIFNSISKNSNQRQKSTNQQKQMLFIDQKMHVIDTNNSNYCQKKKLMLSKVLSTILNALLVWK